MLNYFNNKKESIDFPSGEWFIAAKNCLNMLLILGLNDNSNYFSTFLILIDFIFCSFLSSL